MKRTKNNPYIIQGGRHADDRGTIAYVNDFKFEGVKRFYTITHKDTSVVRAWQGHRFESKYFYCLRGAFLVNLVKLDNWKKPSVNLPVQSYELSAEDSKFLFIPPGFANGFKALSKDAQLLVLSDKTLEESINDDIRFDMNYWFNWSQLSNICD